ncbi:TRAP transporter small permease [Noviherbaspirillum saxi]|uniref:TRAP transporter small permease protein n=2 Tax=Noviherbaspirillum saxi TaxID=2320863 RepID=A0A3A3G402_9BURK|nr:TRAP transporter small permease [Noviherbaspirillum saxi]
MPVQVEKVSFLTRFNAMLCRAAMVTAVAALFGIVFVVVWQVFGRYVLNDTPTWAEGTSLVLVIYVTMLGAAAGVRDAGHIGMESILILLPEKLRTKFEIVIHALVASFGVAMVWYGTVLGRSVMNYKIPSLGVSEGINYVAVVIAGVLIILFCIEHIIAIVTGKEVIPSWH